MSQLRNRRYYSGYKKSIWWIGKRERLYKERGGICEGCMEKKSINQLTPHHIIPKSKGGRDVDANLLLLCARCHGEKHNNKPIARSRIENNDEMEERE